MRVAKEALTERACNPTPIDLDHNPLNLYNKGLLMCDGTFTTTDYDPTRMSWTAGVNRELLRELSVYGRVDHGVHFLSFNDVWYIPTGQTPPEQTIKGVEVGLKFRRSGFMRTFLPTGEYFPVCSTFQQMLRACRYLVRRSSMGRIRKA